MLALLNFRTLSILIFTALTESQTISISVPGAVPTSASPNIDHAFPSLAFETASYPEFSGNHSTPNIFSRNLVQVIANKTGKAPIIRIGGNSGDRSRYDANQSVAIINPGTLPPNITIGPPFFEGLSNFPTSKYTWQVTLARQCSDCQANAIEETQGAINGMGGVGKLDSLELGNEPDLYVGNDRASNYMPSDYVTEWQALATAVKADILGLPAQPFQALVLSSIAAPPWDVDDIFNPPDSIDSGNNIKSVSQHFYQATAFPTTTLANSLMNHTNIVTKLDNFKTSISYLIPKNIPFVLGEVGSALNPPKRPKFDLSDDELMGVLGSALWTVDFMLYSMTIGITRVNMQQGTRFPYAAWQPTSLSGTELMAPHVRAPFYGYAFIADFIGPSTSSALRVKNLNLDLEAAAAYSAYEAGVLQRVALVNLAVWNSSASLYPTPGPRPVTSFRLQLPSDVSSVTVAFLAGPGASSFADDEWGVSWAGERWTFASCGFGEAVRRDGVTLAVDGGVVTVGVNASAAAVVTMNR